MVQRPPESTFHYFGQRGVELLLVIAIIGVVVVAIAPYLHEVRYKASLMDFNGVFHVPKIKSMLHYAIQGEWPADNSEAGFDPAIIGGGSNNPSVQIEDGAVHFYFRRGMAEGRTLTLRSRVPEADALGPVHWVAGAGLKGEQGWITSGTDRTDIEPQFIPRYLR